MKGSKVVKIKLDKFGSHLGMEKGCFVLRDKEGGVKKYPIVENKIGEVILQSGSSISVGALVYLSMWDIDCLLLSGSGKPVGTLRNLHNDSHISTRLAQYKATENEKGLHIAKQIVLKRIESQNLLLRKYGLRQHDFIRIKKTIEHLEETNLRALRRKLLPIEGRCSNSYFTQLFKLFAKDIRTSDNRKTFRAFDAINNNLNFVYTLLKWKTYASLVKAKLEPHCGYLHSEQVGKPSLLCDIMELYRCNADDLLLTYSEGLKRKDFIIKSERHACKTWKREYLNDSKTRDLRKAFYSYLEQKVDIPRIKHGNRQSIETLISEECLLLAKYLRGERKTWIPRIPILRC